METNMKWYEIAGGAFLLVFVATGFFWCLTKLVDGANYAVDTFLSVEEQSQEIDNLRTRVQSIEDKVWEQECARNG